MNNHSKSGRYSARHQKGVGLLEILITVLLLSIGFLAAAKMQVQGMRFSQSAYIEAQAYFMITDMMDRMRSNSGGVEAGHYDNKWTAATLTDPKCNENFCDEKKLAEQDLFDWSAKIHSLRQTDGFIPSLPSSDKVKAKAGIVVMANGMYELRASWIERVGNDDKEQEMKLEFAL